MTFSSRPEIARSASGILAVILSLSLLASGWAAEKTAFNGDWKFRKGDDPAFDPKPGYRELGKLLLPDNVDRQRDFGSNLNFSKPEYDDNGWRTVTLPHDWGIEGPFRDEYPNATGKLPWWGVAWYRKTFDLPADDKGKQICLDIDGAMSFSTVWLNGAFVGGWPYGYTSYRLDLTSAARFGERNVLAVRLDNPPDSSRWYPGGGIYRNVWLVKSSSVHIPQHGTRVITQNITSSSAEIELTVQVVNKSDAAVACEIINEVTDAETTLARSPARNLSILPGKSAELKERFALKNVKLWSPQSPQMYSARTSVRNQGAVLDSCDTPFGVRAIRFDPENGFILNGTRIPLHGVCNHHDLGALGAAINDRALERQIELLKEMGCNAIRTSHNPPAPELLRLCDQMGMLVMVEAFDCWGKGKRPNDYSLVFNDWHETDLRAMVRRDRNHPSVILWSIGNEVREQGQVKDHLLAKQLTDIVHSEDWTRPVTVGCSNGAAGFNGFQTTVDVFGYNYKPGRYQEFHQKNPSIPLCGSETSSCVSSRGEYFFPVVEEKKKGRQNFQISSYDLYGPGWSSTPDVEFKAQDTSPFVAGEFVWTGFDYLGEPTPYNQDVTNLLNATDQKGKAAIQQEMNELGSKIIPSRSSYFGILDLAGFPKDRYYLYQSHWRPELPMVHILPHWNWPERIGQVTPVHVYTSGDEAELFLNGRSLGRKKKEPGEYRLRWDDVIYEPGSLKALACREGKLWCTAENITTGEASAVSLSADRSVLAASGTDLSYVTVSITDANGRTVPRANNRLHFRITGPGDLAAVDNGDPTSAESFQATERAAFNGLALVILRSRKGEKGEIVLEAAAESLKPARVSISAR